MKKWTVKLAFTGLAGPYQTYVDVEARTAKAAKKKAEKVIGNRTGEVVHVQEAY